MTKRWIPLFCLVAATAVGQDYDLVLVGGSVIDGTGNPWFDADVGIRDGRIVAVGSLEGHPSGRTLDVSGLTIAPGFIDLHSHADGYRTDGLRSDDAKRRAAPNLVSQGVTTVVVNQDGRSPLSIASQREALEEGGFGPNAVLLVGHNTVRAMAMAENPADPFKDEEIGRMQRLATSAEIETMKRLVREGMDAGAYGMSAGLEYIPGRWSDTDEVIAVVETLAPYGGVFVEHERASGADPMWYLPSFEQPGQPTFLDSIAETIEIAERTGVVSVATHAKARGADYWGSSRAALQLIDRARDRGVRVFADHYPYNTTGSDGSTRLIPEWVRSDERAGLSYPEALEIVLGDASQRELLEADIRHEISRRRWTGETSWSWSSRSTVTRERRSPSSWASSSSTRSTRHSTSSEMAIPDRRGGARLRGYSLSEIDVEIYAGASWMATASDAGIALPGDGFVHARFYGTFPRKIRRYAHGAWKPVRGKRDPIRDLPARPDSRLSKPRSRPRRIPRRSRRHGPRFRARPRHVLRAATSTPRGSSTCSCQESRSSRMALSPGSFPDG